MTHFGRTKFLVLLYKMNVGCCFLISDLQKNEDWICQKSPPKSHLQYFQKGK